MKKKDVLKAVVLTQGEKIIAGHWSLEKDIKRNKIEKKRHFSSWWPKRPISTYLILKSSHVTLLHIADVFWKLKSSKNKRKAQNIHANIFA